MPISSNLLEREQKQKIWQALGTFAGPELRHKFDGTGIDSLENIIILEHNHHVAFGKLNLWFTPDEVIMILLPFIDFVG